MDGILSENAEVGRVMVCGHCEDIHVVCGAVTLRLTRRTFAALAEMLGDALAHPSMGGHGGRMPCLPARASALN
jgi:hypothetical protein